ncbi:UNVERIFIED_CONTAM: hypothetical protein HDU68_010057 [Siphonaria sp. JEL0065]|nr:hypothetical protein HDU68_010057 [Siphonaria sp. JEL0065]
MQQHLPLNPMLNLHQQRQQQSLQSSNLSSALSSTSTLLQTQSQQPQPCCPSKTVAKRLSAFAQPFIPTPIFNNPPLPPPGYQQQQQQQQQLRQRGGYNATSGVGFPIQSQYPGYGGFNYSSGYRGSRDDMEGVFVGSLKKSNLLQSRHARKNRNNELDYYYSEDEDLNESSSSNNNNNIMTRRYQNPASYLTASSPTVSNSTYSASIHPTESTEDDLDDDEDKMSISSEESVEFVLSKEGARCLPLFLTSGLEQKQQQGGRMNSRSLSESPVNRGGLMMGITTASLGPNNKAPVPPNYYNLGNEALWNTNSDTPTKRTRSVSATATPPALSRTVNLNAVQQQPQFQQHQTIFRWIPAPSSMIGGGLPWPPNGSCASQATGQSPSSSTTTSTLKSVLNSGNSPAANVARIRAPRRHSHTMHIRNSKQARPPLHSHIRRSLSISDVKTKSVNGGTSSSVTPLKAIDGSVLSALASMNLNSCASAGSPVKTSQQQQQNQSSKLSVTMLNFQSCIPTHARFEFSKRYYMDLEIPSQYHQQHQLSGSNRFRKTAQIRRGRPRVSSSTTTVKGVPLLDGASTAQGVQQTQTQQRQQQQERLEQHRDDDMSLMLIRTASEPSLLTHALPGNAGQPSQISFGFMQSQQQEQEPRPQISTFDSGSTLVDGRGGVEDPDCYVTSPISLVGMSTATSSPRSSSGPLEFGNRGVVGGSSFGRVFGGGGREREDTLVDGVECMSLDDVEEMQQQKQSGHSKIMFGSLMERDVADIMGKPPSKSILFCGPVTSVSGGQK